MQAKTKALPKTILGVPGLWETPSDIVTSIAKHSGGYLFAGAIMLHIDTQKHFRVEVHDRNDHLADAFGALGGGRFSEAHIRRIREHTYCLYLVSEGGSLESARQAMDAGKALLNCGGLGVKIESAGTAHSPDRWRELCDDGDLRSMLEAFVAYVGGAGQFYSCGMHNLGYPDCIVEAPLDPHEAALVMHTFLEYLLVEKPTLNSGETISVDADAPRYRLFQEDCSMFDAEDLFHNPYGMWKLVPAS